MIEKNSLVSSTEPCIWTQALPDSQWTATRQFTTLLFGVSLLIWQLLLVSWWSLEIPHKEWGMAIFILYLHSPPWDGGLHPSLIYKLWHMKIKLLLQVQKQSLYSESFACSFGQNWEMRNCSFSFIYSAWLYSLPDVKYVAFRDLSGLKVSVPTKFLSWSPNPQSDGIRWRTLRDVIRAWVWKPHEWNYCHVCICGYKRCGYKTLPLRSCDYTRKNSTVWDLKQALSRIGPSWHPDLRIPDSRTVSNTFLLFTNYPVYAILLKKP